jgi:CxxC-x17-CxxC domain-containing protein
MRKQLKPECDTIAFVGDYNRQNSRSSERRGFGSRGASDRPMMHRAVCANCGNTCEVPFKPNGSKPVYCKDCFQKQESSGTGRSEGRRFERSDNNDRQMYDAVCSNCGDNCKIPFQPREGRPVFCSRCFEKNEGNDTRSAERPRFSTRGGSDFSGENRNDNRPRTNDQPNYKAQFEALNTKMDKILALLTPPEVVVETPPLDSVLNEEIIDELVEEVTEEKPKKEKKTAVKKNSEKKSSASKTKSK